MRIFIIMFLVLISFGAWSGPEITLQSGNKSIKQGALTTVTLKLNVDAAQALELQKLKGQTLNDILYLYDVRPLMKKENSYEADATVVFAKVPEVPQLTYKISNTEVLFTWVGITIEPTTAPKAFIFGEFTVPGKIKIIQWLIGLFLVVVLAFISLKLSRKLKTKKNIKLQKLKFKEEINSANTYEDVVLLWRRKAEVLAVFPDLNDAFKTLESELFKYQFKQSQSDEEKAVVLNAYHQFRTTFAGVVNGI